MDKKNSKIFLITIITSIILLTVGIFLRSKEEVLLEDISGNRTELGNMIITYQKKKGLFQTDEINISKEKIWTKSFVNEGADGFELSQNNLENRELLKYISTRNDFCEDENEVATVSLMHSYLTEDDSEMIACIEVKNKETKDIKYYEIPVNNAIDTNGNTDYIAIPIKDKDNIYVTILSSTYDEENVEDNKYGYEETYLSLYKINTSSGTSKLVLSKSYDGGSMFAVGGLGFSIGDTSYFTINQKQGDEYRNVLFGFNVKSKKITELDLGSGNYAVNNYLLDGDKVLLSSIQNNKKEIIKTILVDLNKNKIINENQINLSEEKSNNVISINRANGKLYLVLCDYKEEDFYSQSDDTEIEYFIYVIDEKTNDVLYKGKITEKDMYNIKFGIMRNNEI